MILHLKDLLIQQKYVSGRTKTAQIHYLKGNIYIILVYHKDQICNMLITKGQKM